MGFDLKKQTSKLLLLLLIADLVFVLLHSFRLMDLIWNPLFSIEKDRSYGEMYQYIKELWIVVLLFILTIQRSRVIYFAWSLLFLYLLFDDSLQIHEQGGRYLADYLGLQPMFNLGAKDFGEIIVSMFFGLFLFTFIGIAYLFSDNVAKTISKKLFILVMSVAFFGVVVDMIHIAIPWGRLMWGLLEDGGEMIIMSIIVWYVFALPAESESTTHVT